MQIKRWSWLLLLVGVVEWTTGCGRQGNLPPSRPRPAEPQLNLEGLKYLAQVEPADAKSVIDLRKVAKDGDDVVIVGRVGGSKHPVVSGRAAFTIVDLSLKSCDDDPNCYDFA